MYTAMVYCYRVLQWYTAIYNAMVHCNYHLCFHLHCNSRSCINHIVIGYHRTFRSICFSPLTPAVTLRTPAAFVYCNDLLQWCTAIVYCNDVLQLCTAWYTAIIYCNDILQWYVYCILHSAQYIIPSTPALMPWIFWLLYSYVISLSSSLAFPDGLWRNTTPRCGGSGRRFPARDCLSMPTYNLALGPSGPGSRRGWSVCHGVRVYAHVISGDPEVVVGVNGFATIPFLHNLRFY